MTTTEIISLTITVICLVSFCVVFTFLFRHYFLSQIHTIESGEDDLELFDNAVEEARIAKSKRKRVLGIVGKVASYLLLALIFAFFVYSLVNRFTSGVSMIGNQSMIVIGSGSMSEKNKANTYLYENDLDNQFNTYDIIQVRKYKDVEDVELYDVVAYKSDADVVIIHRVIDIQQVDGERVFITRGDSNSASDNGSQYSTYLTYDRIIGYYTNFRLKGVGVFIVFLQSNSGIITIVSILYCFIMYEHYSEKYQKSLMERTDFLLESIPFSIETDSKDDIEQASYETLTFKGQSYVFREGRLVEKKDLDDPPTDVDLVEDKKG